ncbi:MAG: DUF2141 domain-containing protein [Rhodocyclaceae bacterium]|jgi:uncharacterized protein (DUF2141 family)
MQAKIRRTARLATLGWVLGAWLGTAGAQQTAPLEVVLTGVHSATGTVRVGLYRDPATFRKEAQAVKVVEVPAAQGDVRVQVDGLPAGRYAIMAYHDENANQKLDLRLGMFPIEGYGLSNNPSVIGPPKFDDSAFTLAPAGGSITMEMRY